VNRTSGGAGALLNAVLTKAGLDPLDDETACKFEAYLSLILRWNAHLNLTSLRAKDAIISRHLAESVACARALPDGIASLLDFGSGAGLPGIPIALCWPQIAVTLAESQGKKAAFLQEAVRVLGISATVYADRAENLNAAFDCVILRAVDKMSKAIAAAANLVVAGGWLALMTSNEDLPKLQKVAGPEFTWLSQIQLPDSMDRVVAFGSRVPS
jgi:16S rRNA (guanine527-N7)-methyltransferase